MKEDKTRPVERKAAEAQEQPQPEALEAPEQAPPEATSSFDISRFKLSQKFEDFGGAKKLLTTVPVRKPRKDEFIRVSPDPKHRADVMMLEYGESKDIYFLTPEVQTLGFGVPVSLVLAIDRDDNPFIWPLKLPQGEGRISLWQSSAMDAAQRAKSEWVRIAANMKLQAYEIFKSQSELPEPEWPEKSFDDVLEIAFKGRAIDSAEHIVIQQLFGAV
jgi:hypothetical protein